MDLATLLRPPRVGSPVRYSLAGRLGAVRAARPVSPTARVALTLAASAASLFRPHSGAFHAATATAAREWKAT